jgi:glycosyltransferase involved in cell wall biosynthesis
MPTNLEPLITLALPAYNESQNVVAVLDQCKAALDVFGQAWEIIVIDNHSSDDTPDVVRAYSAGDDRIRLIRHDENRMYSGSCKTAIKEAKGDFVAIMDSDGQMDPKDIALFVEKLQGGADIVFGWRRRRRDPVFRLVISGFFNFLGKAWLHYPFHDLNCGFRAFKSTCCSSLEIRHTINMANPELYVRAKSAGLRMEEVEVRHMPRTAGKTSHNLGKIWKIFLDVDRHMRALATDLNRE